jgi:hypothetical protein
MLIVSDQVQTLCIIGLAIAVVLLAVSVLAKK